MFESRPYPAHERKALAAVSIGATAALIGGACLGLLPSRLAFPAFLAGVLFCLAACAVAAILMLRGER